MRITLKALSVLSLLFITQQNLASQEDDSRSGGAIHRDSGDYSYEEDDDFSSSSGSDTFDIQIPEGRSRSTSKVSQRDMRQALAAQASIHESDGDDSDDSFHTGKSKLSDFDPEDDSSLSSGEEGSPFLESLQDSKAMKQSSAQRRQEFRAQEQRVSKQAQKPCRLRRRASSGSRHAELDAQVDRFISSVRFQTELIEAERRNHHQLQMINQNLERLCRLLEAGVPRQLTEEELNEQKLRSARRKARLKERTQRSQAQAQVQRRPAPPSKPLPVLGPNVKARMERHRASHKASSGRSASSKKTF